MHGVIKYRIIVRSCYQKRTHKNEYRTTSDYEPRAEARGITLTGNDSCGSRLAHKISIEPTSKIAILVNRYHGFYITI